MDAPEPPREREAKASVLALSYSLLEVAVHRTRLGFMIVISSIALIGAAPANAEPASFGWEIHDTGSELSLTALDAVSAEVAWTASFYGIVMVTTDGGTTFTDVTPPDSEGVVFPDIEALSADVALVLAVPPEGAPHILRTKDSGATWTEVYRSTVSFPGCMAMIDNRHGFLVGDPVDGKFSVDVTSDGGRSWAPIDPAGMPDALQDEATLGFAGNCAAATGKKAFFGTGFAADGGRVFRSDGPRHDVAGVGHAGPLLHHCVGLPYEPARHRRR